MPMVTVDWLAGRSAEQKQEVAARITAAVAEIGDTDPAGVWVVFRDVAPADWASGGKLIRQE